MNPTEINSIACVDKRYPSNSFVMPSRTQCCWVWSYIILRILVYISVYSLFYSIFFFCFIILMWNRCFMDWSLFSNLFSFLSSFGHDTNIFPSFTMMTIMTPYRIDKQYVRQCFSSNESNLWSIWYWLQVYTANIHNCTQGNADNFQTIRTWS